MKPPYPVGTLCEVVARAVFYRGGVFQGDAPTAICTVDEVPSHCPQTWCRHVCRVAWGNGDNACVDTWRLLRPIAPPADAEIVDAREEVEA